VKISGRQLSVLHAITLGHVSRTRDFEYEIDRHYVGVRWRVCTTTVYTLEELGVITLSYGGEISVTALGITTDVLKMREREAYERHDSYVPTAGD